MLLLLACQPDAVDKSAPTNDTSDTTNPATDTAGPTDDVDGDTATGPAAVRPVEADGVWTWSWGDSTLAVDPREGARVTRLAHAGVDVLSGASVHPTNWGSTFWTSPQADWGWPPVAAIDGEPYTAALDGDTLVLTSGEATVGDATITVEKRVSVDIDGVTLAYTIHNVGDAPARLAGWEITRVPTGGLTFFPAGTSATSTVGTFPSVEDRGIVWYAGVPSPDGDSKLVADGSEGWLAHAAGGVLLVQSFADLDPAAQAPGEGEVELFAGADYLELENQGAYTEIAPGASATHTVRWRMTTLPEHTPVEIGSAGLTALARSLVGG